MNPPNLEKWQQAGRELETRQRLDLVGVDHPLAQATVETNMAIWEMKAVWTAARLRVLLGKVKMAATFDGRQN